MSPESKKYKWFFSLIFFLGLISLGRAGLLNLTNLGPAFSRLGQFGAGLFPPKVSALPSLGMAMLETVEIAFTGTLLGFLGSLPLAFFSARVLWGPRAVIARSIVAFFRTIPSILYGVLFVVGFGLGPSAGIMAVAFYTVGYLAKLFYEAFDAVDPEVVEAIRTTGAGRIQLLGYVLLPETLNNLISQLLFMFEYNIRASTIMGFVGAGGIGYYILGYVQMLQYRSLCMALILTFVVVMTMDIISQKLRARLARII